MEHYNSDFLLVEKSQKDKSAFGLLYQKHAEKIRGYFLRRVGEKEVADDLTQDVFLHAFAHIASYRHKGVPYLNYLFTIAHNALVNYYKKKKTVALDFADDIADAESEKAVRARDMRHDMQKVHSAAHSLAEGERQALFLKYWEEKRVKEIAYATHKTENAVKLALSRGRKKLTLHPALRVIAHGTGLLGHVRRPVQLSLGVRRNTF